VQGKGLKGSVKGVEYFVGNVKLMNDLKLAFDVLANYIAGWKPAEGALGGVINAFWIWLGFVMPVQAGGALWSGKTKQLSWAMFLIGAGYQLVTLLLAEATSSPIGFSTSILVQPHGLLCSPLFLRLSKTVG
jgi:hypothetical protein